MKSLQLGQISKYIVIGLLSNAIGYGSYLILTQLTLSPKTAMSLLYLTTAALSFFGNQRVTFAYYDTLLPASLRYCVAQGIGYLINLLILIVFVDKLGYNHKIVQAGAIITVACFLFISMKFFVFRRPV